MSPARGTQARRKPTLAIVGATGAVGTVMLPVRPSWFTHVPRMTA